MMAVITKAVQAGYGMLSGVIASETVAKMSQGQLENRLWWVADLQARGAGCRDRDLARYYEQVAKNALTALAPSVLEERTRGLRTKADLMGPGPQSDMLRRQADELQAANPQPPKRAGVRKAGDPVSSDQTSLTALYDCNGVLYGVADGSDIIPALDPDVIMKAASAGMVATHDPATGKPTGFVDPEAITPVTTGTAGKPRKTGKPAAPDALPPAGAAEERVAKAAPAGHVAVRDERGRLMYVRPEDLTDPATAQARNMAPVRAGGTTGMGQPRTTGPAASLPFDGPQAILPGDAQTPGRKVIKAAGRESAGGVPDGRVAAYTSDGRFLGYVRPDAKFPAGTPDAEGPSAGPGRIDLTSRQVAKAAARRAPRHPDGRVVLLRDLPPRSARRKG